MYEHIKNDSVNAHIKAMTSSNMYNRKNKVYQVRAFYTEDTDDERAYTTNYFSNIDDAHTIYQYAMLELGHHFVSVELVEYPKKGKCIIIDRETAKDVSCGNKARKSLRLILKKKQETLYSFG